MRGRTLRLGLAVPALALSLQAGFGQEAFTVRDSLNRIVLIPAKVGRVVSLQPEVTRIIVALGCGPSLAGQDLFVHKWDILFRLVFPQAAELPVLSYPDGTANIEAIVELSPDLIFASPSESHVPESLRQKTGRPVVALSSLGRIENLVEEIRLVGRILGKKERAEDIISLFRTTLGRVQKRQDAVAKERRPRVYLAFWESLFRTPVSYEPVDLAGGINVAEGMLPTALGSPGMIVNAEKIVQWDPEIILVHGNYPPAERKVRVDDVLGDARLKSVKAVREKRVYYTFGYWYWWDPAEVLVETLYLAELFHPELYRDVDIVKEGDSIFKMFYGLEEGFSSLCRTLGCHEWAR